MLQQQHLEVGLKWGCLMCPHPVQRLNPLDPAPKTGRPNGREKQGLCVPCTSCTSSFASLGSWHSCSSFSDSNKNSLTFSLPLLAVHFFFPLLTLQKQPYRSCFYLVWKKDFLARFLSVFFPGSQFMVSSYSCELQHVTGKLMVPFSCDSLASLMNVASLTMSLSCACPCNHELLLAGLVSCDVCTGPSNLNLTLKTPNFSCKVMAWHPGAM